MIETLVAFAMLALLLIVLLGGLSRSATAGRRAEILREALRLAQAKLDAIGVSEPLTPGESSGRFDNGFEWRLRVRDASQDATIRPGGAWAEVVVAPYNEVGRAASPVSLLTFKLAPRR